MSIEEKPQLLEFNCTIEGMEDISWNIKYDPNDKIALHISGNGQTFHCPVELFGDVTAFLQSKNIIKPNILTRARTAPAIGFEAGGFAASLLPPKIEGQDNTPIVVNNVVPDGPPMDALASFDITDKASNLTLSKVDSTDGIVAASETKSEISKRAVIRTRVSGDDPQSAEKEAAAMRGIGAAGSKKTIKKKHQIAE